MAVVITTTPDTRIETVFWLDVRTGSVGVGFRTSDDAWAGVIGVGTLNASWASGDEAGEKLTADQLADCLRCLAGAVYE